MGIAGSGLDNRIKATSESRSVSLTMLLLEFETGGRRNLPGYHLHTFTEKGPARYLYIPFDDCQPFAERCLNSHDDSSVILMGIGNGLLRWL
jgi:hypothetical protein